MKIVNFIRIIFKQNYRIQCIMKKKIKKNLINKKKLKNKKRITNYKIMMMRGILVLRNPLFINLYRLLKI